MQETHPQAFSTIDPKSVQDQGLKMCITWIVGVTMHMLVLKWTKGLHTHTLLHLQRPHAKGEGPTHQWAVARRRAPSPDGPVPPNRLIFGHMQEDTKWSNVVRRFEVVHWRFDPRARMACHMD